MEITGQPQRLFRGVKPYLNGMGQIMLQNNSWTGLFFLAGVFCGSLSMGIAAILSVVTGTITAKILRYDKHEIDQGLYGFSAALVGVALLCFFQSTPIIWIAVIVGAVAATIIQHHFIVRKFPAFTLPFILVTWLYLYFTNIYPEMVKPLEVLPKDVSNTYLSAISRGMGQVIFQDNVWAGILFLIGIFVNRPIAAIYAVTAVVLSSMLAYMLNEPQNAILMGLMSYNAVLCALVFVGKRTNDLVWVILSVVLSVLITSLIRQTSIPPLTFPFVLATWLTMFCKQVFEHRNQKTATGL